MMHPWGNGYTPADKHCIFELDNLTPFNANFDAAAVMSADQYNAEFQLEVDWHLNSVGLILWANSL